MIRFVEPLFLLLLLLIPAIWWTGRRLRTVERGRRVFILIARTIVIAALALATAQPEIVRNSDFLTVYYLFDTSDSVPPAGQEPAKKLITQYNKSMTARDEAGLIAFAGTPSLETAARKGYSFDGKIASVVETARTDIAGALRLALAAFPGDRMRRIVLFSDGNENAGSALEVARLAKSNNIPIDVVPLRYEQWQDVSVDKLVVPQQVSRDAPFEVKIYVSAARDSKGTLRLLEDGKLIGEEPVEVKAGRNLPYVLPRRLVEPGFHRYQAVIDVAGDPRAQNNVGESFTYMKSEPRVLYIEGDESQPKNELEGALKAENINVTHESVSAIPGSLADLQKYDALILSNVPASSMSRDQMKMIERGVHDLGIGLIMIGGESSFGAGGYQDTPIEEALPVSMDVKQKKMLPNGALCIILHTCEIASGNAWAREISLAALDVLSSEDYYGLIYYGAKPGGSNYAGGWGEFFAWDPGMQKAGDKRSMRTAIKGVEPSDMPTFGPTLDMAYKALKPLHTQVKHIVMISDGDPSPPAQETINGIRDEGITVSTVAIAPHAQSTVTTLENIAYWGGGNFYYPKTSAELPRIFTKEATVVRKSLISEATFVPSYVQPSEILRGLESGLPSLRGLVVTTPKDLATMALVRESVKDGAVVDTDPVLAHWRYGLGKSVAFTSDAKSKWAADWVSQPLYGKFWSQLVRWSLRETSNQNYQVSTDVREGEGRVVIDALDEDGAFRNYLDFAARVIGPDLKAQDVRVRQVAPGRYEGTFPAPEVGSYMLSMKSKNGEDTGIVTTGASVAYSPEYETTKSNDDLLEKVASSSNGKVADADYNPFAHNLTQSTRLTPLWPPLLLVGLLMLPLDIFARRVYFDWAELRAGIATRLRRVVPKAADADAGRLEGLKAAKARATAPLEEEEEAKARAEFRARLDEKAAATPAGDAPLVSHRPDVQPRPTAPRDTQGGAPPAAGGTMGSLLEAKKRAQRRSGSGEPVPEKPPEEKEQ